MKLRVRPGPRPGWGRIDLPRANDNGEYTVKGRPAKVTRIGRFQTPCLVFPLSPSLRVGDEVEVEEVLKCKICGARCSATINGLCDRCYEYSFMGDAGVPPLAGLLEAGRGR